MQILDYVVLTLVADGSPACWLSWLSWLSWRVGHHIRIWNLLQGREGTGLHINAWILPL
jgi:hypothetical protein